MRLCGVKRCPALKQEGGAVAEWVRALACTGGRKVRDEFESHCGQLRFGTLAIPFTPPCQCLSEEKLKAVGPFYLDGVYARGSKRSHQSALECVTVMDSPPPECDYAAENTALHCHLHRKKKKKLRVNALLEWRFLVIFLVMYTPNSPSLG